MRSRLYIIIALIIALAGLALATQQHAAQWPVAIGSPYPDLQFFDENGKPRQLSEFRGKVILLEPIGMTCPGCQAFSGGNKVGGLKSVHPQPGLQSFDELLQRYAQIQPNDDRLVVVQVLFYSLTMGIPTAHDVTLWKKHFMLEDRPNVHVLFNTDAILQQKAYSAIPGFQLIDANGVLRSDSTGHHPAQSLYSTLLPLIGKLLRQET